MTLEVIVLAAGKGTRMRSALPKVLHELAGRPLLEHVLDTVRQLTPARIHVVYGYGAELVRKQLADADDPKLEGRVLTGYRCHHLRCDREIFPSHKTDQNL